MKKKIRISDLIIDMHDLARDIKDPKISHEIRMLANQFAIIGNKIHETGTEDPIDFPLV